MSTVRLCLLFFIALYVFQGALLGQVVPIIDHNVNSKGQVELTVNSSPEFYYVLKIRHDSDSEFDIASSITLGQSGATVISEPLSAYPENHYQVLEYSILSPFDTDSDGIDDMTELENTPFQSPFNTAEELAIADGLLWIDSLGTFEALSITKEHVQWSEFLNGKSFVKYMIVDFFTESPQVLFINSGEYELHEEFAEKFEIDFLGDHVKKGQIIYHPDSEANNGDLGVFAFNYSNGHGQDFEVVQRTLELLASNMPFLENNLSYFITENNVDQYFAEKSQYDDSRIPVLFEADVYSDVEYWGLNRAEGYGFFRHMTLEEIPGARDIVLYESLPNSLPRVGGIITSVIQTPLSHVNLRAIQNGIPNAYIQDPFSIDSIADLLDNYIYFRTDEESYVIREASVDEVNAWFEELRPEEDQIPLLNLNFTSILPLEDIGFGMYDGFGAKCANVATMGHFGFPEGTIPDGFGVPFYFYQEFMKYNDFFSEIAQIIEDPSFIGDREIRSDMLKDFRVEIENADMPDWMLEELDDMHKSFPEELSIRCRSSTNNEDLPGFSGAGLYDSKTQKPSEGHISKSIKEVFASLWNLRAFEEREFYRVDHFIASMGVLCHPNYSDEKSNGVGVSKDPIYATENTFYLNTQLGEDLITNPDSESIPEEQLIKRIPTGEDDIIIVQRSNLIQSDTTLMGGIHIEQMREYLSVIHDEFELLYDAKGNENFAMDIEYKVTSDNQLIIKQARPWVGYSIQEDSSVFSLEKTLTLFPVPSYDYVTATCSSCQIYKLYLTDMAGRIIQAFNLEESQDLNLDIYVGDLPVGVYFIAGLTNNDQQVYSKKIVKQNK